MNILCTAQSIMSAIVITLPPSQPLPITLYVSLHFSIFCWQN